MAAGRVGRRLIEMGIDVNLKNKNDMTPLHLAVNNNQVSAIQFAFSIY